MGQKASQTDAAVLPRTRPQNAQQHSECNSRSEETSPLLPSSLRRQSTLGFSTSYQLGNGRHGQVAQLESGQEIEPDGCFPPHGVSQPCPANPFRDLPVYRTLHKIRKEVIAAIGESPNLYLSEVAIYGSFLTSCCRGLREPYERGNRSGGLNDTDDSR